MNAVPCRWLGVLLGVGALTGCGVNSPQIPSTNFQISIPVADDRTTVEDLADEGGDFAQIDSGGFQLKEDTRIEFEPIFRRFQDDDARRRIQASLDSIVAVAAIENHLPTAIRVSLRVAPRAEDVYGSEALFADQQANGYLRIPKQGAIAVAAGAVGPEGQVVASAFSHQRIALADEDVEVFLREKGVYTGLLVELDKTPSVMRASDFVAVEAGAVIFMEFNEGLIK